ncbi:phage holin family protein [Nodosilinea sp. LEGE 07298]|uniref:phage holin family protein n=1 Tax=Nodosilinea sp. LEGE 07298 TaxID=2777970 RepID=UPI001880D6D9|nr:phage holin family protein [Nodosilinea sp. LEGE 07298]MBE9114174.1 phage holin family protein [Nodosilinea sp. LEGE 07298]
MNSSTSTWDQIEDYVRRVLRLGSVLVDIHLDVAMQEANYEKQRLLGGFVMLAIGVGMLATAGVLAEVAGVVWVHLLGLSWLQAIGAVAGGNLVMGLGFLGSARARLSGPVMTQTQARLTRSIALLKAKEE